MSTSNSFVVGQCTRVRDSVFMKARAQSVDGSMRDLTHTSQNEFPPDGEIELRGARATLKQDDWAIARPVLDGPPRRQRWVSQTARKLLPFEDLSGLSGPEAARRLLVETGLQDGYVGEKIFRIGAETDDHGHDGPIGGRQMPRHLGGYGTAADLPFRSDEGSHDSDPGRFGFVDGEEPSIRRDRASRTGPATPSMSSRSCGAHSRRRTRTKRPRLRSRRRCWRTPDKLAGQLSGSGEPDPKVAQEILRSRRLGELLASRPALIAEFMSALRRDPDIAARIEQEIARLTTETVEAKRAELTAQLTASHRGRTRWRQAGADEQARGRVVRSRSLEPAGAAAEDRQPEKLGALGDRGEEGGPRAGRCGIGEDARRAARKPPPEGRGDRGAVRGRGQADLGSSRPQGGPRPPAADGRGAAEFWRTSEDRRRRTVVSARDRLAERSAAAARRDRRLAQGVAAAHRRGQTRCGQTGGADAWAAAFRSSTVRRPTTCSISCRRCWPAAP